MKLCSWKKINCEIKKSLIITPNLIRCTYNALRMSAVCCLNFDIGKSIQINVIIIASTISDCFILMWNIFSFLNINLVSVLFQLQWDRKTFQRIKVRMENFEHFKLNRMLQYITLVLFVSNTAIQAGKYVLSLKDINYTCHPHRSFLFVFWIFRTK